MTAELISVGTEILMGNILNSNARYLAEKCASLGLDMYYQVTVGDNYDRMMAVVKTALDRSDIVIVTGGLGPTEDDLTKEVCAEAITEATTAPEAKSVETKESLAKELNEERKKVFKQVVKDFYSVEIEATTGSKRGFRPKIEALEATLNAAKPSAALIKKQLKSLTGMLRHSFCLAGTNVLIRNPPA
jgi:molybdenum cofactor synthesis domain-containing protein